MLLACSIVSRTDNLPRRSSSSSCFSALGIASCKVEKSSRPPPDFAIAFLASALFKAIASLMLMLFPGLGSGSCAVVGLGLEGVVARVDLGLASDGGTRPDFTPDFTLDLNGVDGSLMPEREEEGLGIRDMRLGNYI